MEGQSNQCVHGWCIQYDGTTSRSGYKVELTMYEQRRTRHIQGMVRRTSAGLNDSKNLYQAVKRGICPAHTLTYRTSKKTAELDS